jgi:hypothetical protein
MKRSFTAVPPRWSLWGAGMLLGVAWSLGSPASAQEAASCVNVRGALLSRPDGGPRGKLGAKLPAIRQAAAWTALKAGAPVLKDALLVALFEAELASPNGAVGVKMAGDIGEFGPLPVLESAIRIHQSGKADLALTLERGAIVLTNNKKKGAATVALTVRDQEVDITLEEPGTKIGLEVFGRHAGGLGSIVKDEPTTFFIALVAQGEAELAAKGQRFALDAPPGAAAFRWDSATRTPEVVSLDKFPAELIRTDKEKATHDQICAAATALAGAERAAALAKMLQAPDALQRRAAVTAAGALDNLPLLLGALTDEKHADVREQAVLVLRQWLGRSSGQAQSLRLAMLKTRDFSLPQTQTVLHLLFGFDDQERVRPAVKDLLVTALDGKNIAIRQLAHWHLVRLEPKGRDIPYDAAAAEPARAQAVERWHKLLSPTETSENK